MDVFLLIARLILSIVFGVAGIAKLFDRAGSGKAIRDFGLPENLAKPFAVLLPLAEIATAILLLPLATAWWGAAAAAVLLLVFIAGIVYNLAQGKAPDCHCFGQIHSEPVGWSVLLRNLILTIFAVTVVFAGRENAGASAFVWFGALSIGEQMQFFFNLIVVGFLIAIFLGIRNVIKTQVILQRQLEVLELTANEDGARRAVEREDVRKPSPGLPVGAIAPDFAAPSLDGRQITLEHLLLLRKPILLFFVSPNCNPCTALLPVIEGWQATFGAKLTMVLVSSGTTAENRQKFGRVADFAAVLLQEDRELARLFRSEWTPGAVLVNPDGTIGSILATGDRAIVGLVDDIKPILADRILSTGDNSHTPENIFVQPKKDDHAPLIGQIAPDFTLPNLDGDKISLSAFRGMKTVLLFWRASCPFCQQLTERLKAWEKTADSEFNLVILATNEPEIESAARAFRSTVLVETNLEVQRMFDFDGTPGAIVINEDGTIISDLASGEEDFFALVGDYRRAG